jgi:hypothetical protein
MDDFQMPAAKTASSATPTPSASTRKSGEPRSSSSTRPNVTGGGTNSSTRPIGGGANSADERLREEALLKVYSPPVWSSLPLHDYGLEVLKDATIVEEIDLSTRQYYVCGRHPTCHLQMAHPSSSRWHGVFQFRETGEAFVYDLASAHGVFVNRQRIVAKAFVEVRVGDFVSFGASKRRYILTGPERLLPPEQPLRPQRPKQAVKAAPKTTTTTNDDDDDDDDDKEDEGDGGVSWGMAIDDDDVGGGGDDDSDDSDGDNGNNAAGDDSDDNGDIDDLIARRRQKGTKLSQRHERLLEDLQATRHKLAASRYCSPSLCMNAHFDVHKCYSRSSRTIPFLTCSVSEQEERTAANAAPFHEFMHESSFN